MSKFSINPSLQVITGFEGFLFIGDVHLAVRPGRRVDDYGSAVLGKLSQAARHARERKLVPVCLGDLFHKARENNLELLTRAMTVLREFELPLLVLAGSHDRTESWFTNKDAAQLLALSGVVQLVEQPGHVLTLDCKGERVHLWATPANCLVPDAVEQDGQARNVMITHHDFDFRGMYPGAHELHEIENCDMLVNGHMHTPAPMVLKGRTACHNPGSIARVSVDLRKHAPVVSAWTPQHGISLEAMPLVVTSDVFDLTGQEVFAAEPKVLKAELPKGLRLSSFAAKLRATESLEAGRTDDGAVMVETLDQYFKTFEKPDNLKRYLTGLLAEVIAESAH